MTLPPGTILYFGVWPTSKSGHYLYDRHGNVIWYGRGDDELPLKAYHLDSGFCPRVERPGSALLWRLVLQNYGAGAGHEPHWTVLAFWDRTGDHRNGSSSTFVCHGYTALGFDQVVQACRTEYPEIWKRIDKAGMRVELARAFG